jgi:AcrR family transcriptional regulator
MEPLGKILASSIELFSQYGFKTVTMDDIARRSGISKKTLYQHFANKHEVVSESVSWYKNNTSESCLMMIESAENAVEAMVKMLAFFDNMYKRMNPMALFELQRFFPEAYQAFREVLMDRDVALMRINIVRGIQEGYYRPELDADLIARYRLETALLIMQPNLVVNDRTSLMSVAMEIGEHFMYGIMTAKGQELYRQYKEKYLTK